MMQTSPNQKKPQAHTQNSAAQNLFAKLIREINQKLTTGVEYEKVLDFIFETLDVLIPFDRMGLALLDETESLLQLRWVRSKVPVEHLSANYSAPVKGSSLEKIIETGMPRIINDLSQYAIDHPQSESTRLILEDGIRSSMTCPLSANNKAVGVVFFSSCQPHTYDDSHVETFLSVANELSVIVEQGRLKQFFTENAARAQTLRMILHDLKSPLAVISGFIDSTLDEDWYQDLNPDAKKVFSILRRNSDHMLTLLGYLEEVTQITSASPTSKLERVNLREFCTELTANWNFLGEKKNIRFKLAMDPDLPEFSIFSPQRIRRALENLATNAVKFSFRGTEVTLRISSDPKGIQFSVSDQGQGIPENELSKIFKEFAVTSVRPTEGESSTGLGLAIVKKIAERHGSSVSVKSKFGKGSTFSLWLPKAAAAYHQ